MPTPEMLLARLEAIGRALEATGHGLALIGLGSVGVELARLDEFSDLDFFAIAEPGHKAALLADLGWLAAAGPIAYAFQNTADGYKLLFEDDVFCEFAIFEPAELAGIPFAPGRVVWKQPHVGEQIGQPARAARERAPASAAWLVGEALTNLYVGLGRYLRGERLAAARLIQQHAVDRVLELAGMIETAGPAPADPFAPERRFEQRFPGVAGQLGQFVQGYKRSPASAAAILGFLERHFEVSDILATRIRALIARCE